jgi:hypothetical protein
MSSDSEGTTVRKDTGRKPIDLDVEPFPVPETIDMGSVGNERCRESQTETCDRCPPP